MRTIPRLLVALLVASTLGSCGEPDVDKFRREGGSAPDPTGVIEGTVLYIGPRPKCEYSDHVAVRPKGRVILTLFQYDNPPPPTGSASTAENLLTIPGSELFPDLGDCIPEEEEADYDPFDPSGYVMRSVAFVWPEIHLDVDQPISYQIRGFFDYDADFNPFFSATNLPTFGDVVGGALVRVPDPGEPSTFLPIDFPSQEDAPNGAINDSPTVTLGAVVNTERPVFEIVGSSRTTDPTALDAEATITITSDLMEQENDIKALTNTRLHMIDREPSDEWQAALDAAGLNFSFDDERAYAWYIDDVDADGDGGADLHPILGAAGGVPWLTPIVIAQRVPTADELANGVPDVLIIGSIPPTLVAVGFKRVFYPNIDVLFPPVAAVVLNPDIPECRIPYIPAGNEIELYERIPVMCHELPTGPYSINIFHGRAGSTFVEATSFTSETEWDIVEEVDGKYVGQYSGQAWSVPNELGDPTGTMFGPAGDNQLGNPDLRLPSQGPEGRLIVYDSDPSNPIGLGDPAGNPTGCDMAVDTSAMPPETREVTYMDVPEECCQGIDSNLLQAFCDGDLQLCEAEDLQPFEGIDAAGHKVHRDNNNNGTLECLPFLLPPSCCRIL